MESSPSPRGLGRWRLLKDGGHKIVFQDDDVNGNADTGDCRSRWPAKLLQLDPVNVLRLDLRGGAQVISLEDHGCRRLESVESLMDACIFGGGRLVAVTMDGEALELDWRTDIVVQKFEHEETVRFRRCAGGERHLTLVDARGLAWCLGRGPQAGLMHKEEECSKLRKLDFFGGFKILSLAAGKDFNLALVERIPFNSAQKKSENVVVQEEDSGSSDSILSKRASCPLGLPIDESTNEGVKEPEGDDSEDDVELRKRGNSSDCSDQANTQPKIVERLAHSGLYINPSDALKYLSDQLSWVGKTKTTVTTTPVDENLPQQEETTVVTNLYKATSAMADGVKYVGQTVSKLSYSFSSASFDKGNEDQDKDYPKLCDISGGELALEPLSQLQCANKPLSQHRRSQSASMLERLSHRGESSASTRQVDEVSRKMKGVSPKLEVWFWGSGRRGQAGQGDMLDRLQPTALMSGRLVRKVVCGDAHCLALTAPGEVFGWGDNSFGQASQSCTLKVCLKPTKVPLPDGETACDIAVAGGNTSCILTDSGKLFFYGRGNSNATVSVDTCEGESVTAHRLLDCGQYVACLDGLHHPVVARLKQCEKRFLLKLQEIQRKVIEPLCSHKNTKDSKRDCDSEGDDVTTVRARLSEQWDLILDIVVASVGFSWGLTSLQELASLPIVRTVSVFEEAFGNLVSSISDCLLSESLELDSQEFVRLSPVMIEVLEGTCRIDPSNLGQDLLKYLVCQPRDQPAVFTSCLVAAKAAVDKVKSSTSVVRTLDQVSKAIQAFKQMERFVEKEKKSVADTKNFFQTTGSRFLSLKTCSRRLILSSKKVPIQPGGHSTSAFAKSWIILLTDVLVHAGYSNFSVHPLQTVWVDGHKQQQQQQHEIVLVMPEDTTLTLVANCAEDRNEWYTSIQRAVMQSLKKRESDYSSLSVKLTPPITRRTGHKFQKAGDLKGAEYFGTWLQGKMHGFGCLTWADGRCYAGHWRQNCKHGTGKLQVPVAGGMNVFDGQWRSDKFEGKGRVSYANGDIYEGDVKHGKPHGQGTFKQGRFMGSGASVYIGEWSCGSRQGYGISDDIVSGEKYMGMWSGDLKHGAGCVVTADGVYYEGSFAHGKMTGKGFMLFEDETAYEGSFADAAVFSGHGCLTYEHGDKLEGSFYGNYHGDGMKFNGTIYRRPSTSGLTLVSQDEPLNKDKIGQFSVPADKKWTAVFAHYEEILCLPEEASAAKAAVVWEHLAILINHAKNSSDSVVMNDGLEMIPDYYATELSWSYHQDVSDYLAKAFGSSLHPLGTLITTLANCFNATYGGVRIHPRLLKHAVEELHSLVKRLFRVVQALFPVLPSGEDGGNGRILVSPDNDVVIVSASSLIFPHLLPRVHSSIFMLYALYYKKDDDEYWARIVKWNRHPDLALLSFLGVDQKFWSSDLLMAGGGHQTRKSLISQIRDVHFAGAVESLQRIKTEFTPQEKLSVILSTFREVNQAGQEACGPAHCWSMDDLFPVFQYVVVRARILQLGAEIHMIEDLMEAHLVNGEFGIMFTTLQACYYQILKESLAM